MSDWLDLELAEHLKPVGAPGQLWARVREADRRPAPRRRFLAVPIAALLTLLTAAGALWLAKGEPRPVQPTHFAAARPRANSNCQLCHTSL